MPFHSNKSSPRPDRETKSDRKQQEKIRQREADRRQAERGRQERERAIKAQQDAARIKAAEKARQDRERAKAERAKAMAASIRAKAKAAAEAEKRRKELAAQRERERLAKIATEADYNRRRGIYQDAIAGMENPEVNPVVQKLLAQTIDAGTMGTVGTVVAKKRGGPVGYTKRWQDARKKSKT